MAVAQQNGGTAMSTTLSLDINSLAVPAFEIDAQLRIQRANEEFCRLTGKTPEQLIGRYCHCVILNENCQCLKVQPPRQPLIRFGFASVGQHSGVREIVVPKKGGDAPSGYLVFLITETDGQVDSTQFFQAQKLASLGMLAAGVAHELRNPLAIISTSIYFLADVLNGEDELIEKHLRILQEEVESARRIIEDLLNFARPSTDAESEVDVNQVIREILSLLDKELQRGDIDIQLSLAPVPMVFANLDAIRHALLNLITNAQQAMPNGGTLSIETRADVGENGQGYVVVSVKDTGIGMTEEERAHALDPFFTTKPGGTGLGLAVTYSNIRRLGGDLRIHSKPQQGTTVEVFLPIGGANGVLENPAGR